MPKRKTPPKQEYHFTYNKKLKDNSHEEFKTFTGTYANLFQSHLDGDVFNKTIALEKTDEKTIIAMFQYTMKRNAFNSFRCKILCLLENSIVKDIQSDRKNHRVCDPLSLSTILNTILYCQCDFANSITKLQCPNCKLNYIPVKNTPAGCKCMDVTNIDNLSLSDREKRSIVKYAKTKAKEFGKRLQQSELLFWKNLEQVAFSNDYFFQFFLFNRLKLLIQSITCCMENHLKIY
jgi:hypothetical protein